MQRYVLISFIYLVYIIAQNKTSYTPGTTTFPPLQRLLDGLLSLLDEGRVGVD
jgi:hypothetical protein